MIEDKIRAILAATSAVTNITSTRIYVGILPQSPTYPAITIQPITFDPDNAVAEENSLKRDRIQIDCWGETYADADGLYRVAISALNLNQFSGTGYRIGSLNVMPSGGYRYEESTKIHGRNFDIGVLYELT
jgi:hypothetical protein